MQVEFARLARFDQLTGLANRRDCEEALAGEWQRALRLCGELVLVIFDVDEFEPYNDHYGHPGGDACLRCLAAPLVNWRAATATWWCAWVARNSACCWR